METIELPSTEERGEILSQPEVPAVNIAEQEMDIAAFELWRDASRIDSEAGDGRE